MHGVYHDFREPVSQKSYKIVAEIFNRETATEIGNKYSECSVIQFSGEHWHRFARKEAEKMAAIRVIAGDEKFGIDEIAAFGDDYNDLEMIRKCGTGIAMANGIDEVKQAADYICGSNNEDGVGRWIEKNIL